MQMNRTTGFAFLLIGFGVLILLDRLGIGLGNLMGYLFPILLMVLGYIGIKNNRSLIGWGLMILGIIILLSKLSGLIGWIVAGAMIVYGIVILRRGKVY